MTLAEMLLNPPKMEGKNELLAAKQRIRDQKRAALAKTPESVTRDLRWKEQIKAVLNDQPKRVSQIAKECGLDIGTVQTRISSVAKMYRDVKPRSWVRR